ncbi:MAG: Rv2578c family radical SAM protein [Kineosporiaceae bacterium]
MRWAEQTLDAVDESALPGMGRIAGLVRTVEVRDFPGVRLHEVRARSVLNAVPAASAMPFRWTVNPYRGCVHACVYCFARGTHSYLDLDPGQGFDREIVVKVNAVDVLRREVSRASWGREHVAFGTNTDPYQRPEGRYRLMPGLLRTLAASGTPLSVLTKGPLLRRDLPLLAAVSREVQVGVGVSLAVWDDDLRERLEPGVASVEARLATVRAVREAGLACGVFLAPVLPWLTDGEEALDAALARLAAAGATGVVVIPLHLRPGAREWFFAWLARERPELVPRYRSLYGNGSYVPSWWSRDLKAKVEPLLRRHGLTAPAIRSRADTTGSAEDGEFPEGSLPQGRATAQEPTEQLSLI